MSEMLPVELAMMMNDVASLNPQERLQLVKRLCETLRLNPLTNPFQYIKLNGRLTLYATKGCTDQLPAFWCSYR